MLTNGSRSDLSARGARPAAMTVVLILAGFAALRVAGWLCTVRVPWVWDYGPEWNALSVHLYRTGAPLYPDIFKSLTTTLYPPLVLMLVSAITPLFGHGALAAMEAGRSTVLLSSLVVCAMIFALARRFGASTAAALIVAFAFACSGLLQQWGFAFRVDMPALAFELAALWAFQAGYGAGAVTFCVLAFFSKQSSVAAIAAITLFSWFEGERGRAVALGCAWLGAVAMLTALCEWIWPFYLANTVSAISSAYVDAWAAPEFLLQTLGHNFVIAIAAIVAIYRARVNRLALFFLAAAMAGNFASSLRWGSGVYYFLPTLAALAIVAAAEVDAMLEGAAKFSLPAQVICGAIAALLIPSGKARLLSHRYPENFAREYRTPWNADSLRRLSAIRGPVMTDRGALAMVYGSRDLVAIDLGPLVPMVASGAVDDTALLTAIRCRRFAAIALDGPDLDESYRGRRRFWPRLSKAIEDNYEPVRSRGLPYLMLPRAGPGCGKGR